MIFFVNVPFAAIAMVLTAVFIRETYDKTISKSIDWLGILLLSATLFLLCFALLKGRDYGWDSTLIICMFAGSAVSLALFILTELKVKAPLFGIGAVSRIHLYGIQPVLYDHGVRYYQSDPHIQLFSAKRTGIQRAGRVL